MKLPKNAKYTQLLFVALAFLAMVTVSYLYVRTIVQEQMRTTGNEILISSKATIRSMLSETEISLTNVTFIVENMLLNGRSHDEIAGLMEELTNRYALTDRISFAFNGIYGVIDGIWLDGTGWVPPLYYVPQTRPWYIGAMEANGVNYTDPYIDADTGKMIISVSAPIEVNGEIRGVVAIDFDITAITEFVKNLQLAGGGYGFLLNEKMEIVAHKDSNLIGRLFYRINDDGARIAEKMNRGEIISAERVTNYIDMDSIIFLSRLFNGWHIGIITPANIYYGKLRVMALTLGLLGFTLAVVLCYILLRLYSAQEAADERNKSKSSFLARMSHEIRTPMNAIIGMAELILRDGNLSPKAYAQAVSIKQAGANLLSLINDILDFSKIESGKLKITNNSYMLSSLINDVLNIIRLRLLNKPVYFTANVNSNLPNNLIGDEARIRQVLINILTNAVKYTHEGFVSFSVYGEVNKATNRAVLTFEIADSGIGIKEEDMEKLFDDFMQFDQQTHKGIEGSGLGLAITKSLAVSMNGDISVQSTYGVGSTFTFKLPQTIDMGDHLSYDKIAAVENANEKNILLLEPCVYYARSLTETFENLSIKSTMVTDSDSFIKELLQNKYTNIFMPTAFYRSLKDVIESNANSAGVTLISESSDISEEANVRTVVMPAYSISIANVLNNVPDTVGYTDDVDRTVRFRYPNARVLVVDDIPTNLSVVEGLLAPFDMIVDLAESGGKAIEMVKKHEYDIIFMDHMMPEMDGIEATHAIRNLKISNAKTLPIIALTANAVSGVREMFIQNGMDDFLPKPIEWQKLNAMLIKWLPRDKRATATDSVSGNSTPIAINGLDTAKGLASVGGSEVVYSKTLELFCHDATERTTSIINAFEKKDFKSYAIYIHALKGALGSIGAYGLSSMASALESAAANEDGNFLNSNTNNFINELEALKNNIKNYFKQPDEPNGKSNGTTPEEAPGDIFYDSLSELKTALVAMDMRQVDSIFTKIQPSHYNEEIRRQIDQISQYILIFEYDKAIDTINSLLEKQG